MTNQDQHHRPAPFGTPDTPHVAVRGQATLEAEPELAHIGITITARATDHRTALNDLAHRNTTTLDLIKSYGHAIEKLETSTLVITPELGRGRNERIRTYHGRVHIGATLNDFTALGDLTTRLSTAELTRIDGPHWSLRPDSPTYRTARTQAVRDAVQRAKEYAEALNARVLALLDLADDGLEAARVHAAHRGYAPIAPGAAPGGAEHTPAIDLEPARQTVHAQVTAHFTMTPPDLG
jgi:uncharacterized protein YggE